TGVHRQLALQVPLAARDFRAIEPATDLHLNSLSPEPQRLSHGLAHRPAESNSLLELCGNLLGLQLSVQLRLMNLLNRNQDFPARTRRDVTFQLIDLRPLAPNDDARTRGIDNDLQAVGGPFDINVRDASAGKTLLQIALQLEILNQKITELLLRKPMRMPVLVVAKAKAVWMNFLAQSLLQSCFLNLEFQ